MWSDLLTRVHTRVFVHRARGGVVGTILIKINTSNSLLKRFVPGLDEVSALELNSQIIVTRYSYAS